MYNKNIQELDSNQLVILMPSVRIFNKEKGEIFHPFDQPSKTDASNHGVIGNGIKAGKCDENVESFQRRGASERPLIQIIHHLNY